jgi:outer membrane biosynthesis protein TonB
MSSQQVRVPITFQVIKGGEVIKTETLAQRVIKIGKSPSCTLQVEDDSVSRTHAVVEISGPGDVVLIATDENTFINGKQVNKGRLSTGDTIRLGAIELVVEIGQAEVAEPAPAPTAVAAPVPPPASAARSAPAPMMVAGVPIVAGMGAPMVPGMGIVPGLEAEPEKAAAPQMYVDLTKYEDARFQIGEMISVWGGVVFNAKHFHMSKDQAAQTFNLGENPICDLWLPLEALDGKDKVKIAQAQGDKLVVTFLPGAAGSVTSQSGESVELDGLVKAGRATPSANINGGYDVTLGAGDRLKEDWGEYTFLANMVAKPRLVLPMKFEWTTPMFVVASLIVHVAFMAMAWQYQTSQSGLAVDILSSDNPYLQMMVIAPPQMKEDEEITIEEKKEEEEKDEEEKDLESEMEDEEEGGTGARAAGDEGKMGKREAEDVDRMAGVQGPKDNPNPHMAKTAMLEQVAQFGAVSALQALQSNAPTSPFSPYSTALGNDPVNARGHLMGSEYGDAYGVGGLGMFGTGAGGGGSNIYGFGLGDVGQMGHGYGTGDGVGFGRGGGRMGRGRSGDRFGPDLSGRTGRAPDLRLGEATTFGGLSKEVIRRIVQQNRGRIRHCYEAALRTSPELNGRVTVKFVIAPQGNVQSADPVGNTTGDDALGQCITAVVKRMSFPQADGVTACTYPFMLQMVGDEAAAEGGG